MFGRNYIYYCYILYFLYLCEFFQRKNAERKKEKRLSTLISAKKRSRKELKRMGERKRIGHTWKVACTANTRNRRTQIQFSANSSFLVLAGRHFGVAI